MEGLLRTMVVGGSAVFVGVSATMNALFLSSLGRTPREAALYGIVSVAADVVKAALPVILVRSLVLRAFWHAAGSGALLVIVVVMSLASGMGYAALTRDSVTAVRQGKADALTQAQRDLAGVEAGLQAVTTARSLAVVEAELAGVQLDRRWQNSRECTDISLPSVRQFCMDVQKLRVERVQAADAARLHTERNRLRDKVSALRASGAGESSDPQASAIAALLGVSREWPRNGVVMGLAVLLELGSVVLIILATGPALRTVPSVMPLVPEEARNLVPATVPMQTDRSYWRRQRDKSMMASQSAAADGRGAHHGQG